MSEARTARTARTHNVTGGDGDRPPKPTALTVRPEGIPALLREARRFVLWRYEWRADKKNSDGGKWTKPPRQPNGRVASSTDPATWVTFAEAIAAYNAGGWDGIGRIHLPEDNLVGADGDHVRDAVTGELTGDIASAVLSLNTYTESSPSGEGLRAFCYGRKPGRECKRGGFELYDGLTQEGKPGGRYLTLTGHGLPQMPGEVCDRQVQVEAVYARMFGANGSGGSPKMKTSKAKTSKDPADDLSLIEKAKTAKNGSKFTRLWDGNSSDYKSESEADLALCGMLAFWTGPDPARIDALFRQSGLMRPKWERQDYRDGTIATALAGRTEFFCEPSGPISGAPPVAALGAPVAWEIIRDYWQETLHPIFKRPGAVHCDRAGRELKRRELLEGAPPDLIDLLAGAANTPVYKGTKTVNVEALPRFFSTWAPTAWAALLKQLPDEVATVEVSESAADQFRSKLRAALLKLVAIGTVHNRGKDEETTTVERRPLLHWVEIFAAANRAKGVRGWADVRGHSIWGRYDEGVLRVAMHHDLLAQIHATGLPEHPRKFGDMARLYEVAATGDGPKVQRGSLRLLELSVAFIEDLLPVPEELAGDRGTQVFPKTKNGGTGASTPPSAQCDEKPESPGPPGGKNP
jgi:hypothetical protein